MEVDDNEIMRIVSNVKNKLSYGYHCISNLLLKRAKRELIKPLTLIINLFSTNIPYMEHHFHELILAQWGLIFGIINALLH